MPRSARVARSLRSLAPNLLVPETSSPDLLAPLARLVSYFTAAPVVAGNRTSTVVPAPLVEWTFTSPE